MKYLVKKIEDEFTTFVEALTIRKIPVKLEVVWYQTEVPGICTPATLEELNNVAKEYNLGSIIDNITDITNINWVDVHNSKLIPTVRNKEVPYLPINISYSAHYKELLERLDYLYAYHLKLLAWCYRIEDWHKMRHQKLKNHVRSHIQALQLKFAEPSSTLQNEEKPADDEEEVEYNKIEGNYLRGYNKNGVCIVEYVKDPIWEVVEYNKDGKYIRGFNKGGVCVVTYVKV